ncbi:MAG: lysophospholipid acyltransferase family protein [Micromonosporaceae bacterium]
MQNRRRPKLNVWLWIVRLTVFPVVARLFKLRFRGAENIPASGGALVALNHVSYADFGTSVNFFYGNAARLPRFMVKSGVFKVFFVGHLLRQCGQIPVHRGAATAAESLKSAVAAAESGEMVVIYPEGTVTRDPDWWPMVAKTGVARLALAADVPVIPVAVWGPQFAVDKYNKKYDLFPRKTVTYQAGPPVDLSGYRGKPVTAELLREVTDVIMGAVRDQLADVRGEAAPQQFYRRPDAKAPTSPPSEPGPGSRSKGDDAPGSDPQVPGSDSGPGTPGQAP